MARSFVLVDAIPGREDDVYEALGSVPAVRGRRKLTQKVGNADILALVEAADSNGIEKVMTGTLRGISGVHTIRRVALHHTIVGGLRKLMTEIEREVDGSKA